MANSPTTPKPTLLRTALAANLKMAERESNLALRSDGQKTSVLSRTRLPKSNLANFFGGLARLLFIATLLFSMSCNLHSSNLANFPREDPFWLSGRSRREAGRFPPISCRRPRAVGTVLAIQDGGTGFMRWSASRTRLLSRQRSRPWRSWTTVAQRQTADRRNSAHDALLGNRGKRGRHRIPGGTHQERLIIRSPLRKAVHGEEFGLHTRLAFSAADTPDVSSAK